MRINKIWLVYISLLILISPILTISLPTQENEIPDWKSGWSFKQELILPISTIRPHSIYQPIDIRIEFIDPCWGINENEHSIRVCSWDGYRWHELESQIYDLEFIEPNYIKSCRLVFLIPDFANGEEIYFVCYDDSEKQSPNYKDHVSVEDAYFYYAPISGVSIESDYYKINEDGYCVYGVGQKGTILYRGLSQGIIKMKPKSIDFDTANFDNLASFILSYQHGKNDEDEISSDQVLVSKEIIVDGNLLVQFRIVSESSDKHLRTNNLYKYYYCPTDDKRISVHVKHQVFKESEVTGIENIDGRYGVIASVQSKSGKIKRMRFGEILPYIHVFSENSIIKEYKLNTDPENKEREWIVPYTDDCDLGESAWISYDEGENGKAFGIIFSSDTDIVKSGTDERDGIQVTSAVREYLRILGTEIDYASISFGRNSFEKGRTHDTTIPGDLVVEFCAEFYTSEEGGYKSVNLESTYFPKLVEYRHEEEDESENGEKNIYTLTVTPILFDRIRNRPILNEIFNRLTLSAELYIKDEFYAGSEYFRQILGKRFFKFTKIEPGDYIVKIFRRIGNWEKLIGIKPVTIIADTSTRLICTWEKNIEISAVDQNNVRIEDIELTLLQNDSIVFINNTRKNDDILIKIPYNLFENYVLRAYYKGFKIFDKELSKREKNVDIKVDLYDLTIDVKDKLGFSPGVHLIPLLTSSDMETPIELIPQDVGQGIYIFENLPSSKYKFFISYGRFTDELYIDVPEDGDFVDIKFSALFDLNTILLNSRGDLIDDEKYKISIIRNRELLFDRISPSKIVTVPPGKYTINTYLDEKLVGSKIVELNSDKEINIVTNVKPILPLLITGIVLLFICEITVLLIFKKFSLNTFLKLLALALVFLSIFQPWWTLNAYSETPLAEKNTEMFIASGNMIEKITYKERTNFELANLPEMFTNFLGILLLIIYSGIIFLSISFIPNILLRRRYFLILIFASILFLLLVSIAFSYGMSKITEITLGGLNGEALIDVALPNGETICMLSNWGLGLGFYLCILSSIILIFTGVIDYIRTKKWPKKIFKKK
ncbi:MAG: carboxypeptidase regulatory-like domain-containing protein [Thermoplasmatales archaeon]|nr:MAG: carboxypeptidase regulatory-like domain-containing protein [Thermoplasmatales archaeon]